ncbi:12722_t:CDS:2, partial [Acaulospora colombiana]
RITIRKANISQPTLIPRGAAFSLPETRATPLKESMMRKSLHKKLLGHKRNASEPTLSSQPIMSTSSRPPFEVRLRWGKVPSNNTSCPESSTSLNRAGLRRRASSVRFSLTTNPGASNDSWFVNPRDDYPCIVFEGEDANEDDDASVYSHKASSTHYLEQKPLPPIPPEYRDLLGLQLPEHTGELEPARDDNSEVRPLSTMSGVMTKEMVAAFLERIPEDEEAVDREVVVEWWDDEDTNDENTEHQSIGSDEARSAFQFFLDNFGEDFFPAHRFSAGIFSLHNTVTSTGTTNVEVTSNRASTVTPVEEVMTLSRSVPETRSMERSKHDDAIRETGAGPRRPGLEGRRLTMDEFQQQMLRNSRRSGKFFNDISDTEDLKARADDYDEDLFPMDEEADISRPIPLPERGVFSLPDTREVPLREDMMRRNLQGRASGHRRNASEPVPNVQPTPSTSSQPTSVARLRLGKAPYNTIQHSLKPGFPMGSRDPIHPRPPSSVVLGLGTRPEIPHNMRSTDLHKRWIPIMLAKPEDSQPDIVSVNDRESEDGNYVSSTDGVSIDDAVDYVLDVEYQEENAEMETALDDKSMTRPVSTYSRRMSYRVSADVAALLAGDDFLAGGEVRRDILLECDTSNQMDTTDPVFIAIHALRQGFDADYCLPSPVPEVVEGDNISVSDTIRFTEFEPPFPGHISVATEVEVPVLLSRSVPGRRMTDSSVHYGTNRGIGVGPRRPSLGDRRPSADEVEQQRKKRSAILFGDHIQVESLENFCDSEDAEYVEEPMFMMDKVED